MPAAVAELRSALTEICDLQHIGEVLNWDQSTYMPEGGATARGRQLATISRLAHQRWVSADMQRLLDEASRETDGLDRAHVSRALVRVAKREQARASQLPEEFVGELKAHFAETFSVWMKARPASDFSMVKPYLKKTLELSRRYSDFFPQFDHPADVFIDQNDWGMTAKDIKNLFSGFRAQLTPLVSELAGREQPSVDVIRKEIPAAAQLAFGERVIRKIGYDFTRGRQDLTHHPFMTKFSSGDVRITTRVTENDFTDAFFSTIHECGHALYEQGIDPTFEATPLGAGVSAGVHESQSRLWENLVARSRPFWTWLLPIAQETFPEQFGPLDLDTLLAAINRVERSLIRVDSDEVTYNLHVMIRFDLELQLLEGKLSIDDLPEAWNARFESDLGIRPSNDKEGVLQDVHWYVETFGGLFQGYTLGNLMSAQFYNAAKAATPGMEEDFAKGDFSRLLAWLRTNLHQHGSVFEPHDLVERATGKPLGTEDFLGYLKTKYKVGPLQ